MHVEDGEGLFFMSPGDAKDKLKELKGAEGAKARRRRMDEGRRLQFACLLRGK